MRFEGFDEDVEVYVDYVGNFHRDPIKRARGFIKKISDRGSLTIKFDDPALGEPVLRFGFKLTRLSDGVTYERKPTKGGGNDPSRTGTMVGDWSEEEHAQFLELMEIHGGSATEVARRMETRDVKQVRAHFHNVGLVSGWKPEGEGSSNKRRRRRASPEPVAAAAAEPVPMDAAPEPVAAPDPAAVAEAPRDARIGHRVKIYWEKDDLWYPGRIRRQRPVDGGFELYVRYEDGEGEWHPFHKEPFDGDGSPAPALDGDPVQWRFA